MIVSTPLCPKTGLSGIQPLLFTSPSCSRRWIISKATYVVFLLFCIAAWPEIGTSQCNNGSAFGTATAPTNNTPVTITTCVFGGEYSTINSAVAGTTYMFTGTGGSGNYLTVRQGTPGGTVLGFGFSPISVTCTVSGPIYLHVNTNASCGTDGSCHTTTIQCTSCPGAANPCTNITTATCGSSQMVTLSGSGQWNTTSCGFSTPGGERIYSFIPTATGNHTLQVTSTNSGGYIDYFYKVASGGCNATGWTCIDDIISPASANFGPLTAGVTYYILLDAETTSSVSHTFQINCPTFDPCSGIPALTCGTAVTATPSGSGSWNVTSCGFSTPGQERVYSFTPATSGAHTVQVTSATGGYIDYFYKAASGGCNSTGWTCIDDINFTGTFSIGSLTAGTQYYILLDPEGTGAYSHTFQINCPPAFDPCTNIATLSCNTPVSATISGSGIWSPGACGFSTPGQERVYSFTAVNTGVHNLAVTSTSATGYIDYMFKLASNGCNASSWTCIDDIFSPMTANIGVLTAGTTYYVLLDPETTTSVTHTFEIQCAGGVPACATGPTPGNGITLCPGASTTLSWNAVSMATSYDVYFGTTTPPPFVANTASTSYLMNTPSNGTYYWQIVPRNLAGPATGCTIWSFVRADNTPPTINCPLNVTTNTTPGTCSAVVTYGSISASDNCSPPSIVLISGLASGSTFPLGTSVIVYRATDAANNTATCSFTVTVVDNQAPTITCPPNITTNTAPGVCSAVVSYGAISASDNCSAPSIVLQSGLASGSTFPLGTSVIVYRATDASNNTSTCSFTVTIVDNQTPSITCPANVTVQCASLVPPVSTASVIASDNCGIPTVTFVSDVITNQTCINRYTLTRTYRATDGSGNSSTCAQIITVNDNTAPTITFNDPLLQGVSNGGTIEIQCEGQDPNWDPPSFGTGSITASDNCAGTTTVTYNETLVDEGNCPQDGYINRYRMNWTVTDACGNSATAFVYLNLVDEIPPVITGVPANITVECDEVPSPPTDVHATDECMCACVISFVESTPSPGCMDGQTITRTWTAEDDCGNITVATQYISLVDTKGPEIEMDHPELLGLPHQTLLTFTCNEGGIPEYFDDLTAGDVYIPLTCGTTGSVSFEEEITEANNCEFWGYMVERRLTWTATDACGNESEFVLTAHLIDDEPPLLIGVPDVACEDDPALDEIESIDNCDGGNVRFWDTPIPSPCGTGIAFRRTYEGFDLCGNMTWDTAIIIPGNNAPPTINFSHPDLASLPPGSPLEVECSGNNGQYTPFGEGDVRVGDDCPAGVEVHFQENVLSSGACDEQGVFAIVEAVWTATDMCGNQSQIEALIHVIDRTPPRLSRFSENVLLGCDDALPEINAVDNCGEVDVQVTESILPGECEYEYTVIRSISAVDPCGNSLLAVQTVRIQSSGPVIEGVVPFICDDLTIPEITAYDPCGGTTVEVKMEEHPGSSACHDGQVIERIWSATDACGHTTVVRQTIIMGDETAPVIQIPTHSVILRFLDTGPALVRLSESNIMAELNALNEFSVFVDDECGEIIRPVFTLDVSYAADCIADGYYERRVYTWTASDMCGNSSVVSFTVDIMDDIAPGISQVPQNELFICTGLPPAGTIATSDYTGPAVVEYIEDILPSGTPGQFDVIRTWVATDECGNTSSASQHITWIPDSFVACDIELPEEVACNSHEVMIPAASSGGFAPITYEWQIEGEDCYIQSGQGTSEIGIYVGFSVVEIALTVTDAYGCVSQCFANLDCEDPLDDMQVLSDEKADILTPEDHQVVIRKTEDGIDTRLDVSQLAFRPNPASEVVTFSFESTSAGLISLEIMNLVGESLQMHSIKTIPGYNQHLMDVSMLPEGGYVAKIQTHTGVEGRVIIVVRQE